MAIRKRFLVLLLALCLLCGCSGSQTEQTIVCNELTITLPLSFYDWSKEAASQGIAFNYASDTVGICGVFEGKAILAELLPDLTVQGYAELFIQTNKLDATVEVVDGIPRFGYTADGADPIRYLCGVFESQEHFWVVQAYCEADSYDAYAAEMWSYIKTVKIS